MLPSPVSEHPHRAPREVAGLSPGFTRVRATFKRRPEDFVVTEIPAYEPSGTGEHVYVTFEKRDQNTLDAVRAIARALGARERDAGVAGMKDKHAVTTQTASFLTPRGEKPADLAARALALELAGIRVLRAAPHGNKLKTGHLAGNRFEIVLRDIDPEQLHDACNRLREVGRLGAPNAFGEQRFGRDRDNAEQARRWLAGETAPPRDPRKKRLLFSALQSLVFNAVLDARVAAGTFRVPELGDVLKKSDTGGLFVCADEQVDRARAERGEVVPTGPIFGPKMTQPEGAPGELERTIQAEILRGVDLSAARGLGDGTRRSLVLPVRELRIEEILPAGGEQGASCRVYFVIPKGAYATTVLGQVFVWNSPATTARAQDASENEEPLPDD